MDRFEQEVFDRTNAVRICRWVAAILVLTVLAACNGTVRVPHDWYGGEEIVSRCARVGAAPKLSASERFDVRLVETEANVVDVVISDRHGIDVFRDDRRYLVHDLEVAWKLTGDDQLWILAGGTATAAGDAFSVRRASDGSWSKAGATWTEVPTDARCR